jgi:hypothetical protein
MTFIQHIRFFIFIGLLPTIAYSQTCEKQFVYNDSNRNGIFDTHEKGIKHVGVSNGNHIVYSDAKGRFNLKANSGQTIFVIKPAGYTLPLRVDGIPDFFSNQASLKTDLKYGGVKKSDVSCKSFALWSAKDKALQKNSLEVLIFGDPQPKSLKDVGYYQNDIVQPIIGKHNASLGISLGDIVHDDLSLFSEIKGVDKTLNTPWLYAAGNHDLDFDALTDETSLESFRAQFGPSTFAWEEHQANFIVLDDVVYKSGQSPSFIGGLRNTQFHFLARYLARADKSKLLVISAHIPFFQTHATRETFRSQDRKRLFALLEPFKNVLLLTAHTHTQTQLLHSPSTDWYGEGRLYEYNVGTTSGAYWSGLKDAQGIPVTTMTDGTPNGFAKLHIKNSNYSLQWINARQNPNQAMALYAPKVLRKDAYPSFAIYANVFMAKPDTQVQVQIDGGAWQQMTRVLQNDPGIVEINSTDNQAEILRSYDRIPEATLSTHLWRFALPTNLSIGEHKISVRAKDDWLGEVVQFTSYRLLESEP